MSDDIGGRTLQSLNNTASKTELSELIRAVVRDELNKHDHTCRFNLDDHDVKEFGHFMGMIGDLGNGKLGKGVEEIRANHKWLTLQRERSSKLGTTFVLVIVMSLASGTVTAIWFGIKALLAKQGVH